MTRVFGITAIVLNFGALIIQVLVSVSPSIQALDIVRTNYGTGVTPNGVPDVTQLRFGAWGVCYYPSPAHKGPCSERSFGYTLNVTNAEETKTAVISASKTRGLISHPVGELNPSLGSHLTLTYGCLYSGWCQPCFVNISFFSTTVGVMLPASLVSFVAALATVAAFAVDIFFYQSVKDQMGGLGTGAMIKISLAPWITLLAFVLLLLSAGITLFGYLQLRKLDQALHKQGRMIDAVNNFINNFRGVVNDKE